MALGKKGIFFTIMAIFFISLLFIFFFSQVPVKVQKPLTGAGKESVKARLIQLDDHVKNLDESYLSRVLLVSGREAMRSYIAKNMNDSAYFGKLNQTFAEMMMNGTINQGQDLNESTYGIYYMVNNTLTRHLKAFLDATTRFLDVETNITIHDLRIYQDNSTGPWAFAVEMNSTYWIRDGVGFWNFTSPFTVLVPIEGFYDVPFAVDADTSMKRIIVQTNITRWGNTSLHRFIELQAFKHDERAPSFLQRIQGDGNASSCCGIESILPFDFLDPGTKNMSYVDHCYFFESCPGSDLSGNFSLYNITTITNSSYHFRLEPYHISEGRYNVTAYSYPFR